MYLDDDKAPPLTDENKQAFVDWAVDTLSDGCNTPEDIRVKLNEYGCKGYRCAPMSCPVAQWFWKCCPWEHDKGFTFSVCSNGARVDLIWKPFPFLVSEFISMFDANQIPELRA